MLLLFAIVVVRSCLWFFKKKNILILIVGFLLCMLDESTSLVDGALAELAWQWTLERQTTRTRPQRQTQASSQRDEQQQCDDEQQQHAPATPHTRTGCHTGWHGARCGHADWSASTWPSQGSMFGMCTRHLRMMWLCCCWHVCAVCFVLL